MYTDIDEEERERRTARRQPFEDRGWTLWRVWLLVILVISFLTLVGVFIITEDWEPTITLRTVPISNVHLEQSPAICFGTYRDAAAYYNISNREALRIPVPDDCK